ncbi:uncharacterized protein LOC119662575 [Teleopsis dalmanni]|uniref:uncharacterized protein LOC119662575 n=1 Tax=Teleopsis dalmanni TaxID=139649 RepID=UPI0018CD490B|nr:uncharacterized protein LOC119662575 [Teleopsis dalmanni]
MSVNEQVTKGNIEHVMWNLFKMRFPTELTDAINNSAYNTFLGEIQITIYTQQSVQISFTPTKFAEGVELKTYILDASPHLIELLTSDLTIKETDTSLVEIYEVFHHPPEIMVDENNVLYLDFNLDGDDTRHLKASIR